jgi:hypothetical protein
MYESKPITKAMDDYDESVRLEAKRLSDAIDDAACDKHITKSDNLITNPIENNR